MPGPTRRSLVTAAAWSAPVVLTSTAMPALAASTVATSLTWEVQPPKIWNGEVSTGAVLYAVNDGVPAAGVAVSVMFMNPALKWVGGPSATTRTLITDATGRIFFSGSNAFTASEWGKYTVVARWTPPGASQMITAPAWVDCNLYHLEWMAPVPTTIPLNGSAQVVLGQWNNKTPAGGWVTVEVFPNTTVNGWQPGTVNQVWEKDLAVTSATTYTIAKAAGARVGSAWGVSFYYELGRMTFFAGGTFV